MFTQCWTIIELLVTVWYYQLQYLSVYFKIFVVLHSAQIWREAVESAAVPARMMLSSVFLSLSRKVEMIPLKKQHQTKVQQNLCTSFVQNDNICYQ